MSNTNKKNLKHKQKQNERQTKKISNTNKKHTKYQYIY